MSVEIVHEMVAFELSTQRTIHLQGFDVARRTELHWDPLGVGLGSKLTRWKTVEDSGRQWKTTVACV